MGVNMNRVKTIVKSIVLSSDEFSKIQSICVKLGYVKWSPCIRHLLKKVIELIGAD